MPPNAPTVGEMNGCFLGRVLGVQQPPFTVSPAPKAAGMRTPPAKPSITSHNLRTVVEHSAYIVELSFRDRAFRGVESVAIDQKWACSVAEMVCSHIMDMCSVPRREIEEATSEAV